MGVAYRWKSEKKNILIHSLPKFVNRWLVAIKSPNAFFVFFCFASRCISFSSIDVFRFDDHSIATLYAQQFMI